MKSSIVKPVADPLEDIDRVAPVDNLMARQDRADLPGGRSDIPGNEGSQPRRVGDGEEAPLDADEFADRDADDVLASEDPDVSMAIDDLAGGRPGNGPDDDEPIEETERLGDASGSGAP